MPKSVQISQKERSWFKVALEEKYGLKVEDTHSCIVLSDMIFESTKVLISYNTLRRFFQLVPGNNSPSLFTLNILSNVLGFKNFMEFEAFNEKLERDFVHETIHIFKISKRIDFEILDEIIENLTVQTWESVYQLSSIIELLIQQEHYDYLAKFFQPNIDFDDWDIIYKYYIAFQQIHLEAKSNNRKIIDFIKTHINQSKIVQRILLQLYVEESELEGYFGEWIDTCNTYLTNDLELFKECMHVQLFLEKKQLNEAMKCLEKVNLLLPGLQCNLHPILKGRISAWKYLLKNETQYITDSISMMKDPIQAVSIICFFYRLVYTYGSKKQFIALDIIEKFNLNSSNLNHLDFDRKTEISMFYLLQCRYFFQKGDFNKAANAYKLISNKLKFSCTLNFFEKEYEKLTKEISHGDITVSI